MGWGATLSAIGSLHNSCRSAPCVPVVVGGLFYSVGAVLNLLHWPALWPGTFGPHELFHLFVLAVVWLTTFSFLRLSYRSCIGPPEDLDDQQRI